MSETDETVWTDILHPDTVGAFGRGLVDRAQRAQLFHTGLGPWDDSCDDTGGGLDDFWYVVCTGASNVGKTQLGLALAQRALRQDFAVVFLTLEEPADQIMRRMYAAISDVNYYDFTYARFNEECIARLVESTPYLGKFIVNDELSSSDLPTIFEYLDEARDMLFGRPLVVIFDHLQLVKVERGENIGQAATEVSEGLRRWAKQNRTLTIAFSQLTSEVIRDGRPPRAWDMYGGSAMYSNASQVVVIDHTAKVADTLEPWKIRMWAMLDKNRYGQKLVAMPVEANLKSGLWRCPLPDEHHLWQPNPWERKR